MINFSAGYLPDLLVGSQILGGGGGGRGDLFVSLVRDEINSRGPIAIRSAADLDPDALCLPIAQIGSSTIRSERLPAGDEIPRLVRAVEQRLHRPVEAFAWLEGTGGNAFIPLLAAAQLGRPAVDADGMGRAFSSIVQTTYELAGVTAAPVIVSGPGAQVVTIDAQSSQLEALIRPIVNTLGGWAFAAWYPQTARELLQAGIQGSLQRTLRLGATTRSFDGSDPLQLAGALGGKLLLSGQVHSISIDPPSGARSIVVVADGPPERMLRLEARNEILLALLDGQLVATVPDIICPFSHELSLPINIEDIHHGQPLDVMVLPADARWYQPDALERVGPRSHGYQVDHVSNQRRVRP